MHADRPRSSNQEHADRMGLVWGGTGRCLGGIWGNTFPPGGLLASWEHGGAELDEAEAAWTGNSVE
eukprot:81010-Chlamydomonas_euryale.AAC.1